MTTLEKLSEKQAVEIFEKFPESIQRVMRSFCCDPRNVFSGKLSAALYSEYGDARDKIMPLCNNDAQLQKSVMDYLMGVFN